MENGGIDAYPSSHVASCLSCRQRWERSVQLHHAGILASPRVRESARQLRFPQHGIVYAGMLSPLGVLWAAMAPSGLVAVDFWCDELAFCYGLERVGWGIPRREVEVLEPVFDGFREYFEGLRQSFAMPVDLSRVSPFQRRMLQAVQRVPYGELQSYGDIARELNMPRAARAVGTAVATNPLSLVIPCHRIVRTGGDIGKYACRSLGSCGVAYKRQLLEREGVIPRVRGLSSEDESTRLLQYNGARRSSSSN